MRKRTKIVANIRAPSRNRFFDVALTLTHHHLINFKYFECFK